MRAIKGIDLKFTDNTVSAENVFASIQSLVETTSVRPVQQLLKDYQNFIQSAAKRPKEQCEDQLVDLMYHLHLMSPSKFRLDCYALYQHIVHHQPYEGGYVIYWAKWDGKNMLLSMDLQKLRLYLTEANGRIKPHQKWVKGENLKWLDPKEKIYYNVVVTKRVRGNSEQYSYALVKSTKLGTVTNNKSFCYSNHRERFQAAGSNALLAIIKEGKSKLGPTIEIQPYVPPLKLKFSLMSLN